MSDFSAWNKWLVRLVRYSLVAAVMTCLGMHGQTAESGIPVIRTGILIASDSSQRLALASGTDLFPLRGTPSELTQYERQRVTVKGAVDAEKGLHVLAIERNYIGPREIEALIEQLRLHPWSGPVTYTSPTHWIFNFTDPMLQILQAGSDAQQVLLRHLADNENRHQIIILLGGVGDERAIDPLIRAMTDNDELRTNPRAAKEINLSANLALTNITQSEVIWHHGGGIMTDRCPDDPKSCWHQWWIQNRDTFKVSSETAHRNYSNYPNYGIYQQP